MANAYTFIVVPNASSRLHVETAVRALYVLAVIAFFHFLAVGLGFSYAKMAFKAATSMKAQAENT
jgi:hypothetical protein